MLLSRRHLETNNPMSKILLVVRDFPPGCGSAAIPKQQPTVCVEVVRDFPPGCGGSAKQQHNVCGRTESRGAVGPQKSMILKQQGAGAIKVLDNRKNIARSRMVETKRNLIPSLSKGTQSGSLGGKDLMGRHCPVSRAGVEIPPQIRNKEREEVPKESEIAIPRNVICPNVAHDGGGDSAARDKVQQCLCLFQDICKKQTQENLSLSRKGEKTVRRIDLYAHKQLKLQRKLVNVSERKVGAVPGINIGDTFYYRIELFIVGLHNQTQAGIDCMDHKGDYIATSVVASRSGSDNLSNPNELVYVGQGGNKNRTRDKPEDQQLKCGNLGLKTSIRTKNPVRVIRKVAATSRDTELVTSVPEIFVYDGLYTVEKFEKEWPLGNKVYKFFLKRIEGQPPLTRYRG